MKTKTNNTFKKSVLSILVISAVAGTFIPWEEYQPRDESPNMITFYENQDKIDDTIISSHFTSTNTEALAALAQDNLTLALEAELVASDNIEDITSFEMDQSDAVDNVHLVDSGEAAPISENPNTLTEVNSDSPIENSLLFAFDSSEINTQYYQTLNKTAALMQNSKQTEDMLWQVVGYADLSGNYIYNSTLAEKRAQAVVNYLVDRGVNEQQLSIVSLGASQPLNAIRSVENNKNERRVEIHAYQPEVTTLAKQYNANIKRQRATLKAQALEKENAVDEKKIAEVITPEIAPKTVPAVDFEKNKAQRLSTAMEL